MREVGGTHPCARPRSFVPPWMHTDVWVQGKASPQHGLCVRLPTDPQIRVDGCRGPSVTHGGCSRAVKTIENTSKLSTQTHLEQLLRQQNHPVHSKK